MVPPQTKLCSTNNGINGAFRSSKSSTNQRRNPLHALPTPRPNPRRRFRWPRRGTNPKARRRGPHPPRQTHFPPLPPPPVSSSHRLPLPSRNRRPHPRRPKPPEKRRSTPRRSRGHRSSVEKNPPRRRRHIPLRHPHHRHRLPNLLLRQRPLARKCPQPKIHRRGHPHAP